MVVINGEIIGYEWSEQDRAWRVAVLQQILLDLRRCRNRLAWIGHHLPAYLERTSEAHEHLEKGLGGITNLDSNPGGLRYLPVSPDEFDEIHACLGELFRPWNELVMDPEFSRARQAKNLEIQSWGHRHESREGLDEVLRIGMA